MTKDMRWGIRSGSIKIADRASKSNGGIGYYLETGRQEERITQNLAFST